MNLVNETLHNIIIVNGDIQRIKPIPNKCIQTILWRQFMTNETLSVFTKSVKHFLKTTKYYKNFIKTIKYSNLFRSQKTSFLKKERSKLENQKTIVLVSIYCSLTSFCAARLLLLFFLILNLLFVLETDNGA